MYEYTGIVTKVVDGDTVDIDIDLGFKIHAKKRIRLKDIDTPEIYGAETPMELEQGRKAKAFVEDKLLGKEVVFMSFKCRTGKYGRWLGDIVYKGEHKEARFISKELKEAGFEKIKY